MSRRVQEIHVVGISDPHPKPRSVDALQRLARSAGIRLVFALLAASSPALTGAEGRCLDGKLENAADQPAETEPSISVDGLAFGTWHEYLRSDYFEASGLRCATPDRETREFLFGRRGDSSDCTATSTNPTADYDPDAQWEIPVVVHILMDSNCSQGAISDALVHSQIEILNEDLLALAGTPGGNGRDSRIRFVLASEDPSGSSTNGITRHCNINWFNDSGSYWNTLAWDPHRYLNIYTNTAGGSLGYVPFLPADSGGSMVGSAEDRVVVLWSSFGRNAPIGPPYDQGRTTTHEVGHYFGLEHTFNGGCANGSSPACYSNGDFICDTNPEQDPGSSPCHVGASSSCGSVDPTDNYMDYSDDLCMERFTTEQVRRIRCTVQNYRQNLIRIVGGNTPPQANITAPSNGASFPQGTSISFAGNATDTEDGNLTGTMTWSSNRDGNIGSGGSFSTTLSVGAHTITAEVTDSGGLTGSDAINITVTTTSNQPPVVVISAPTNGSIHSQGSSIAFSGSATDSEDGNLTGTMTWSSNRDGNIGSGGSFSATLSVGSHTVTAVATDSGGLSGSASINLVVQPSCEGGGGLAEDFEGDIGDWSSNGLWHRVTNSSCASPGYSSPVKAMYFGLDDSCVYDTGSHEIGRLISPAISGITTSSTLSFDYFRQVEDEAPDVYDTTRVAISVVGNSSWTTVWERDSTDSSEDSWTSVAPISLASFAGQTIQVRFRFDTIDDFANDFVGWLIDDVVVTASCDSGDNEPPQVIIGSPSNGASFPTGSLIQFSASATDPEDGDVTSSLTWTSNRDGEIGSGGNFSATLSPGAHQITAVATDSGGAQGQATIAITVVSGSEEIFVDGFESGDTGAWDFES